MSNEKLIPCPYCGCEVTLQDDGDVGNPLSIKCKSDGGWCLGNTDLYPRNSKESLISSWNSRNNNTILEKAINNLQKVITDEADSADPEWPVSSARVESFKCGVNKSIEALQELKNDY